MGTNIYLVRHAHSHYTPDELNRPLSERGFLDAANVTSILINENIEVAVSSPYRRAIQTVEETAKRMNIPIHIVDGFKERNLSVQPVDDFEHAVTRVWEDFNFAWEGGESNNQAKLRGVKALHQVLQIYSGKNIAVGTHGNLMAVTMNHFDTAYDYRFWRQLDMPDIYKLSFNGINLRDVTRIWKR
jgi:2,3-bisphosphoglycerate-dependent phosphoglycerate mutase